MGRQIRQVNTSGNYISTVAKCHVKSSSTKDIDFARHEIPDWCRCAGRFEMIDDA